MLFDLQSSSSNRTLVSKCFCNVLILFLMVNISNCAGHLFRAELETHPEIVKMKIRNRVLGGGRYIRTPTVLTLKPASYKITIARRGYQNKEIEVSSKAGSDFGLKMSLEKDVKAFFSKVSFRSDDKLYIEIDDGLYKGTTPMTVKIPLGSYKIGVGEEAKIDNFANAELVLCSFDLSEKKPSYILKLSATESNCTISEE